MLSLSQDKVCKGLGEVTAAELGSSHPWESLTREKLKAEKNSFSLLLIFHFYFYNLCSSVHSLTTFQLGLCFYTHNVFTVSVTSVCARAAYPEMPMATPTASWIVSGQHLLIFFSNLLEFFKTILHFFKAVCFRGSTSLFRTLNIP